MTEEERIKFLREIKEHILDGFDGRSWEINMCSSDFDLRHECRNLEEYKQSFNYLVGQLLRDKSI